ncbi:GAF domain-containing protein [Microcoleus sp.]|uniref:GAF domain-containing protein n=1 Tax=Microcoleus sp. TaxID=44472 RepID=UPI003526694B
MDDRNKTQDQLIAELELLRGEVADLKQTGRSHPETHLPQTTPAAANLTIVLIDDSEVDRATYRRYLMEDRDRTYQIVEFDNGEDALEWCQQQIPDIFLLDYFLPDMDGLELLQQLQQQTGRNTLPVIMFTGQGNLQIAVDLLKSGAQDYLDKSQITPQILQKSISYILRQSQLIREREWQQQQQQLLGQTALSIRESLKLEDILNTTVKEVRNILQCDRVIVFQFSDDWGGKVVVESVADGCMAILPVLIYDPCIGKDYAEPFRKGLITAKSDIYNSGISPCHIEFLETLQVRANLVVPIVKGDKLWGLLAAHHCTAPRQWQPSEIELLQQVVTQSGIAIQQADLLEQLQTELRERKLAEMAIKQLNTELEQRVIERTAELTEVNDRLLVTLLEKEHAYQRLDEQSQLLEDLYNNAPCGYHSVDAEGTIVQMNDTELKWLGYTRDEILHKKKFTDLVTTESQSIYYQFFSLFKAQGWIENLEFQMLNKDGSTRWISLNASAVKDDAGNFLMSRSSLFDISDRKQAETALLQKFQQEKLLWRITQGIRQSLDLNVILNTAVTEVRQTLQTDRAAIYRFNLDWSGDFVVESVGEAWVKLVGGYLQKVCEDIYLQETQGGRFRNHENFVIGDIDAAGLHPCHIQLLEQFQAKAYMAVPIFAGEFLWGLLVIYQNTAPRNWQSWEVELLEQIASQLAIAIQQSELYEQLQIELQERQLAEATIQEAERRWRSLLDNVQLIVVGLDIGENVNYVNPFFLKLTGYTNLEVLGENWFKNFLPPASQESLKTVFSEVLTHNAPPYYRNSILTKSGEERFIAWNSTTLQDAESNIIGNISIGEDITERKKVDEIKDEFIGIVSHELRTPLTAIQMSLGLIQTGIYDKKPEKSRRMIEIALLDTHRLVNLVNDILDLERIDSGRVVLEKTVCKAADLMQQAIERIQAIATQEQITLTFTPTDVEVWAAPDTIIQTLTNLLGNAIKFSPAQSTIHLSAEIQTDFVLFQVCDRGRGIPADQLELIFGRFQQVDASDSREKGGTGLGLSICQSIIERHGGKIWAESSLGEGSTFFFTLPLPTIEF